MTNSAYQYINLDYLNLMTDGDDDMKKVMIDMLFEELPEEIEKMDALQQSGNYEELKAVSHKMKSTLSFIGNDEMTEANKKIETITKDGGDVSQLSSLMQIIKENQPKVVIELRHEYDKI